MALVDAYRKDAAVLWSALGILLASVLYRLLVWLAALFFQANAEALEPMPGWLYNSFLLILVAVLWTAYHRWVA